MPGRVNTKFLITLILATIIPIGIFVCYWLYFVRINPDQLIARGDRYVSQGLYEQALSQYSQAIELLPEDVSLQLKFVDTLNDAKTSDPRTAKTYIGHMVRSLQRLITMQPHNLAPFERLMELYIRMGRDMGSFEIWQKMYEDADTRLGASSAPEAILLAKKYRGIARVNRMERLDFTADQRLQAAKDLETVLAQNPDDRDVAYYLAGWHILEARALELSGSTQERRDEHYQEADRLTLTALTTHPDDPRRQLDRVKIMGLLPEKNQDDVLELMRQVEQQLLVDPGSPRLVLELVEMLIGSDRERVEPEDSDRAATSSGLLRAEKLLESVIKKNPEEPRFIAALGRVLEMQRRYDDAISRYKQVRQLQPELGPFEGAHLDRLRGGVSVKYVNLSLRTVESQSPQHREAILEEAREIIDEVAANHGESGEVNLVRGKIALILGQWGAASKKLDRANEQFKGTIPEALLLSAKAWVQLNESGAATDRLEQLVQIRPQYMAARYELIRLYLGLDQFKLAQQHLDIILGKNPDDRNALRLKAQLLAKSGRTEEAIELYEAMGSQRDSGLTRSLASLYTASGRPQIAKQLLEEWFSQTPTDIEVLQELVRLSDDTQQAMEYMLRAREAGADPKVMQILQGQLEGSSDMTQVLEELIASEADPFNRHLKQYHLYRRVGDNQRASQALAQAINLKPDHAAVIAIQFNEALRGQRWDEAETLAGRASSSNLDLAEGMFYYGRLEAQRGRYQEAIGHYQRGLNQRPIYSEGWRQLGDAQRFDSQWVDAAASYRRALEQRPNNAEALRGLAVVLDAQGKYDEALEHLRRRVRFSSKNRALREQYLSYEQQYGSLQRALTMRQQIASSEPSDIANRRALAILLSRLRRTRDAQATINALIEEAGVNRENIFTAAVIKRNAGNVRQARAMLEEYVQGLGANETDVDWQMLARFLLEINDQDRALAAYRRAVELEDPKMRRATRELADVLFDRGAYMEAVQRYEQLWETSSDDHRIGHRYVEALLRINQPDRAKQILEKVKEKHGVNGGVFLLDALIARMGGDTATALDLLNRAQELTPRRAMVYYQRAELLASDQSRELAVLEDLHKTLELDPDMLAARRLLATIHIRRGESDEAIRELVAMVKRHPRHIAVRLQLAGLYRDAGKWDNLRALLDESTRLFPSAVIWPQLQAQQAMNDNDEAKAIELLKHAFELAPSAQTLGELVSMFVQVDEAEEALAILRGNGEIVREVPILHALRGRSLAALNSHDLAARAFARAVERSETFEDISAVGAQMVQAIGLDETISQLERLLEPSRAALIELGIIRLEVENERDDAAIERLNRVEALVRGSSDLRSAYNHYLTIVLYRRQAFEEALAIYKKILETKPDDVMTLNNAAYMLAEDMNRADEAVPLARRAAEIAPNNAVILDTYGWAMYKAGQVDTAVEVLRRSVRIAPSGLNCLHLGEVLIKRGDSHTAVDMLNKSIVLAEQSNDERTQWLAKKRLDELDRYSGP